ncbi:hypothetical protein RZE82_08260 [Mollicutes bacterium LVI A0039]|nr:hypothetical protein RZE82_08260 [Mollicutes bacterium LVI A0039]
MEKIKIIQFGEGKFLRAFVDVVIEHANQNVGYQKYGVDLIQPLEFGQLMQSLKDRDFKYVVNEVNPALEINQVVNVKAIDSGIDPYKEYGLFKELAVDPRAKFVFSNTTESGIAHVAEDFQVDSILGSFPGKVLQLLYMRFNVLGSESTLTFVPCELIEANGSTLKEIVLKKAVEAELSEEFIKYIKACKFCDTLVDRIVVGYQDNQFDDPNYILCEPFMKWVIDSEPLEFAVDANLPGIIFDNVVAHRELKVKILNGLHTALTPFAILEGVEYVHNIFENELFKEKLDKLLEEILLTITLENKHEYAKSIIERFQNEKLNHKFSDIMLNSLDKYHTRDYPTVLQNLENGMVPTELLSSLCAIVVQYKCGFPTNDSQNKLMWDALTLENPALALIEYKFEELKKYSEAIEFINHTCNELREKYEKCN